MKNTFRVSLLAVLALALFLPGLVPSASAAWFKHKHHHHHRHHHRHHHHHHKAVQSKAVQSSVKPS